MGVDVTEVLRQYRELLEDGIISDEEYEENRRLLLGETDTDEEKTEGRLSNRVTGIVAYIGWIGFLVAILAGDYISRPFHVNQALLVHLFSLLAFIPFIGWVWAVVMVVFWAMGLYYAVKEQKKELPLIGGFRLIE